MCASFQETADKPQSGEKPLQGCADLELVESSPRPAGGVYGGRPVSQDIITVCSHHKHVHVCSRLPACLNKTRTKPICFAE